MHVKSLLLCTALCDPMDYSLLASSVHGILQVGILEWVAFSSPGDLPNPRIEPGSPVLQADALPSEPPGKSTMRWNVISFAVASLPKVSLLEIPWWSSG